MKSENLFESKYGYFSKNGKEYIITTPKTPKPWVNVISNGDYSIIISQTGSGYSWRGNAGQNRITRLYQDLIKDNWGKYFYIRDLETNKYWSAGWKPVKKEYEEYKVIHGMGYTKIIQKNEKILSEMLSFVTSDDPVEIIEITLTNLDEKERKLDVTSYFEWVLGNFPDEHREFYKLFVDSEFDEGRKSLVAKKYLGQFPDEKGRHNNTNWDYIAFHATSEKVKSYTADKECYIGMYGDEKEPKSMKEEKLEKKLGRFTDLVASLQVELNLKPNESKTVVFLIGAAEINKENYIDLIEKYNSPEKSKKAFERVQEFWNDLLEVEHVETPDEAMNIMTNYWLKYQAISGRILAKSGYYQVSAGYGFRDQLQDSQIFLTNKPELMKKQILLHAKHQFNEGDVLHWWLTFKDWGPRTKCSDDLLWLPFITIEYLKETKDFDILDEMVPFLDDGEATLYEHCKRALEKSFSRFSPRGIPLMGENDWNDGLSALGTDMKGESFWVAEFLYKILKEFKYIFKKRENKNFIERIDSVLETLKTSFNKYGWDGEWYLQATTDSFEKVGSKENKEGKIFLMPQIWSIISGISDEEKGKIAMDSVTKYLLKDYGTLLLTPEYTEPRTDIGYITRYAPGLRENGGVYTHAATWSVWAYSILKQCDLAYEAYRRICPPNRSKDIDRYVAEPYVTPGNIDGPISPYYGRGGWTWYTGSSQWLQKVATHNILGIYADWEGLKVEPCIPKDWEGFKYRRKYRNAIYIFDVKNLNKIGCGVKELYVDGEKIEGNIIPDFNDGKEHFIEVILGN